MKRKCLLVAFLLMSSQFSEAQVRWGGIYDFEFQKGGYDSRSDLNGLPNSYPQLGVHQFQLFLDADLSEHVSVSTMIVNTPTRPFELKGLEFQLASANFKNLIGDALSLSLGKIYTPFGTFTKRQLAPDNPLIGKPLFYNYSTNISPTTGYLDSAASANALNTFGARLSTIYPGGYYVGAEAFGSFLDGLIDYDVALMNTPLACTTVDYDLDEGLALHGRVALHPAIWGTFGFSYAGGSYMQESPSSVSFTNNHGPLNQFKQTTFGADALLSYLYYELNAEYIYNRFDAPYIVPVSVDPSSNGFISGISRNLGSDELLVDLKLEAPFYPGLYLALRYDQLTFNDVQGFSPRSAGAARPGRWSPDANRYGFAIGYKPEHSVLLKLGYERTLVDVSPQPDLDVLACSVVVTF